MQTIRRALRGCALLALASAGLAGAATNDTPPSELLVDADVRVAADGAVADYRLNGVLDHALADRVEHEVRQWRFAPVLRDGQPVPARTRLLISLQPAKEWDRWVVADVSSGRPALARRELRMPDYPESGLRAHLSARVVLDVKLAATGKVEAVHVEQTSLDRPQNPKLAAQWAEIFDPPAVRAAKSWKFLPPESVDGQPVGASFRIAIVFPYDIDTLHTHQFYPGPVTPAPWLSAQAVDDASQKALADGEIQPLEERVHLAEDVVGQVL
jgi:TonB family protein